MFESGVAIEMSVKIVTDSTSYIPLELRKKYDITVVSLSVTFDSETYREEEIDNLTFYNKMSRSKTIPTSSQPSPQEIFQVFEKLVLEGHSVVGIFLSSEMSGTFSGACLVKKMIIEKYPDACIEIIDSRSNCMELGFAALAAARAASYGQAMAGVINETKRVIARSRFIFVPDTLEYLHKVVG
ncbi:hypothetical protein N752_25850 [Desulforamulus aquiferis]|nr:hypothetical protein N752_25850 [Desulforamulus aquiferis]